jgi:hypothetical protein
VLLEARELTPGLGFAAEIGAVIGNVVASVVPARELLLHHGAGGRQAQKAEMKLAYERAAREHELKLLEYEERRRVLRGLGYGAAGVGVLLLVTVVLRRRRQRHEEAKARATLAAAAPPAAPARNPRGRRRRRG